MDSVISIRDLKLSYKHVVDAQISQKQILNIPKLDFKPDESVFLFGSSGSGKTTLLEILAGVLNSDSGEVQILNEKFYQLSLSAKDQFRAKNIGYIFQQFNLIPYLTVKENILLPFTFNKKNVNLELYQKLVNTLGLTAFENQLSSHLSVGQQQRVAAARESFLKILFQLVKDQKSTLIFVSHDRSIMHLFDRQLNLTEVNQAGRQ
jgi:putative ABC transport system ATP-binding protein